MVDVLVEHEYIAQEDDELTIKPGDVLSYVNKMDGGWWEGTLNGKTGVFPDNFVREVPRKEKEKEKVRTGALPAKKQHVEGANVGELTNRLGGMKIAHNDAHVKKVLAKVTFAYNPEHEDELKLDNGDIVEITKQEEEGWWEGIARGKSGVFPSNFVEIIEDSSNDDKDVSKDTSEEDTREVKTKKSANKVGFGNIFEGGPIKLRSVGSKDEEPRKPMESNRPQLQPKKAAVPPSSAKEPPALPPKDIKDPRPVERAKVLFSYEAENDDELSLAEGVTINILDKNLEDNGWWKGELNGKIGVFPDNFVSLLPHEEKPKVKAPMAAPEIKHSRPQPQHQVSTDRIKREDVREDKKVPAKKPVQGNKKTPKPLSQTDDMKAQQMTPKEQENKFAGTEVSDSKLSHPTASRVRPPRVKKEEEKKTAPIRVARPAPPTPHDPAKESPRSPVLTQKTHHDRQHPEPKATRVTSQDSAVTAANTAAIEELKKEHQELRANSVSREDFASLQRDIRQNKEDMDRMQTMFNKKLINLMKEVDEEKKIRLNMQVEMDRVKKLVVPDDDI